MHHPLMKLAAVLATAVAALMAAWQGIAGVVRGTVLVFKRSGTDSCVALADKPAAFWFCVVGWFVLGVTFAGLCRHYWRAFNAE